MPARKVTGKNAAASKRGQRVLNQLASSWPRANTAAVPSNGATSRSKKPAPKRQSGQRRGRNGRQPLVEDDDDDDDEEVEEEEAEEQDETSPAADATTDAAAAPTNDARFVNVMQTLTTAFKQAAATTTQATARSQVAGLHFGTNLARPQLQLRTRRFLAAVLSYDLSPSPAVEAFQKVYRRMTPDVADVTKRISIDNAERFEVAALPLGLLTALATLAEIHSWMNPADTRTKQAEKLLAFAELATAVRTSIQQARIAARHTEEDLPAASKVLLQGLQQKLAKAEESDRFKSAPADAYDALATTAVDEVLRELEVAPLLKKKAAAFEADEDEALPLITGAAAAAPSAPAPAKRPPAKVVPVSASGAPPPPPAGAQEVPYDSARHGPRPLGMVAGSDRCWICHSEAHKWQDCRDRRGRFVMKWRKGEPVFQNVPRF